MNERLEEALRDAGSDADSAVLHVEAQDDIVFEGLERQRTRYHIATVGKLHGIPEQVQDDLPQPVGIAAQRRYRRIDVCMKRDAFGARQLGNHVGGTFDHRPHVERRALQLEFSGLDLREIQDAIDQRQQRLGGFLDRLRADLGALVQFLPVQQFRRSDDRRERRAQFMAHRGDELGLEPRGIGQLAIELFELRCVQLHAGVDEPQLFGALALRDVGDRGERERLAIGRDRIKADLDWNLAPIFPPAVEVASGTHRSRDRRFGEGRAQRRMAKAEPRRDQHLD